MNVNLGDKFGSFRELQEAIATYSKANFVDLHIRDSRTLQAAVKAKRISEARGRKKELVYSEVMIIFLI